MTQIRNRIDPAERAPEILVTAIGEVLWDVFPSGPRFGGAPANFACAVAGLAARKVSVAIVSAVGNDDLGQQAIHALQRQGVATTSVTANEHQTGQVNVALDQNGVASYEFVADCAWDNLTWTDELQAVAEKTDVVCFGTLGQRSTASKDTIQRFVRATASDCLRIFDINLRPPYYSETVIRESLAIANVLKLNEDELPFLAGLLNVDGSEQERVIGIAEIAGLDVLALTRGENGALIYRDGLLSDFRGVDTEVVDTVGAGDAFTAAMVVGLLAGKEIDAINREACEVAAFVCSQTGATPVMPSRFSTIGQ